MSHFTVPRPTRRNLRPDAVAYVDPQFPAERLWSPYARPVHGVERGEDIELTGELTLVDREPLFTGEHLQGTYETYWFTGLEVNGVSILAAGAQPVGAVGAGYYSPITRAGVALTTREGLSLLPDGDLPQGHAVLRGAGTGLVVAPLDFEEGTVPIDVLLDAGHRPCGYIVNGDLDLTTWESRILPDETGRVSSEELFAQLQTMPPDHRPQVVARKRGLLGRAKTTPLGHLGEIDLVGRSWEFTVVPEREAMTVMELVEQLQEPEFRRGPDLGVEGRAGEEISWVTALQRDGGGLQVVLSEVALPDAPL